MKSQVIRSAVLYSVLVALLLFVVAALPASSLRAQDEPVVLDWVNDAAWHKPGQDAVGAAAQAAIGVNINTVMFANTDAFQASVRGALPTNSAFPLFDWWFKYRMKDLVDAGLVADVTDIWQKHIAAGEYPASLMDSFGFDGKAYALPKLINYWVVFYNKHVFEQYKLQPPTTWEEFMTIADTLKTNGVTPFGLDTVTCRWCSFIWFEELLVRTDPQVYQDLMTGKVAYNDPKVIAVMNQWKDLLDKGYFTTPGELNATTVNDDFVKGTYAMSLNGDWWTANVERSGFAAGTDYGIFVMPGITDIGSKSLIIEGRPVLIANNSPQKDAALKFADYFMGVEAQTIWAETGKVNSPNLKVADSTRPEQLRALAADVAAGKYTLYTRYWEATPPDIVEQVVDQLGAFVVDPTTLQADMDAAQQIAADYWAKNS